VIGDLCRLLPCDPAPWRAVVQIPERRWLQGDSSVGQNWNQRVAGQRTLWGVSQRHWFWNPIQPFWARYKTRDFLAGMVKVGQIRACLAMRGSLTGSKKMPAMAAGDIGAVGEAVDGRFREADIVLTRQKEHGDRAF